MTASILIIVFGTMVVVVAFGYFSSRKVHHKRKISSSVLPTQKNQTNLDSLIVALLSKAAHSNGLILLEDNVNAFAARYNTAMCAQRSLDLQYYYWKNDLTGQILYNAIVQAANRGVRVRLLLDDINAHGFDLTHIALDSHKNIEVRLFNPMSSRNFAFQRAFEFVVKYFSASRRMHNKSWIADGRVAIVGGRNIGDAYFDASENLSFRDVDVLVIGKAVSDAEVIFDLYWNCKTTLSIRALHKFRRPNLKSLIQRLDEIIASKKALAYLELANKFDDCVVLFNQKGNLHWATDVSINADPPEKATGGKEDLWLGQKILKLLRSAKSDVEIVSPYFIPGPRGVEELRSIVGRGVKVSVLTNSLAATDVIAAHGAYANYRTSLLKVGIDLFELKQKGVKKRGSLFGSSSASLHTKSFVIDGAEGFVGSFNLDPRSISINTEMGVFFRHRKLALELKKIFELQTSPKLSYRMQLHDGKLVWGNSARPPNGKKNQEPGASLLRKLAAAILGVLPIESQL